MAAPGPPPEPLKPPQPEKIATGLTFVNPLTRRGTGPGLILLVPEAASGLSIHHGVPSPLRKWAEEGYCVVEASGKAWEEGHDPIETAIKKFGTAGKAQPKGFVGLVCYDPSMWNHLGRSGVLNKINAAVIYTTLGSQPDLGQFASPVLVHRAGKGEKVTPGTARRTFHYYEDQTSHRFATPLLQEFHYATEAVSHTRSLTFLKKHMNGPYFDLEAIWEEHTYYEFGDRDVEKTMNTMVQEPYVNHIPTIMGGIGREELTTFYRDHFHFSNPKDAELEPISRTTGIDRVVDEFIFKCTHDQTIDWLLPGAPATNSRLEIPMMAVVCIRGDRLYHEHIHWDHATVLKQAGLIPEYVPCVGNTLTNGEANHSNGANGAMRLRLPVAGVEGARKLRDKNSVPSNEMLGWGVSR